MSTKFNNLFKNIIYFLLAGFLPRIASFILLPIYTNNLSASELGTADLIVSTVNLLLPILTLEIQDAVVKLSLDGSGNKKNIFSTGINISLLGGLALLGGELLLYEVNIIHLPLYVLAYVFAIYIVDSTNVIVSYFCRGLNKVKILTYGSIISSIASFICGIIFVSFLKLGLHGYLLTNIIANLLSTIYIVYVSKMGLYYEPRFEKKTTLNMIKFSIPLIISALSWWINNASDRYILGYFAGTAAVGIYAVSSKIPNILSTFGNVIAKAYSMSTIKEYDEEDKDGFLGKSYSAICAGMVIGCSALLIINIPLSKLLFAKDFFDAWKYVPILLISVAFNQMALSCQNIFIAQNRTEIVSGTAVIGALVNTVFNILLIPKYGAYGASTATAIGFLSVWISRYCMLRGRIHIKNEPFKETLSFVFLIFQIVFATYGNKFIIIELIMSLCIIVTYGKYLRMLCQGIKQRTRNMIC